MKYITLQAHKGDMLFELGLTFHEMFVHADIAEDAKKRMAEMYDIAVEKVTVVGAGFCTTGLLGFSCFGTSDTLGISTRGSADEAVLESTNLNIKSPPYSGFDLISSVLHNFEHSCYTQVKEMQAKEFIITSDTEVLNGRNEMRYLDAGTRLIYRGPSFGYAARAVHLFHLNENQPAHTDYEAGDYDEVYQFLPSAMKVVFERSALIDRFAEAIAKNETVFLDNDQRGRIVRFDDPWPLTDDHDEMQVSFRGTASDSVVQVMKGTMAELAKRFEFDVDDDSDEEDD